MGFTQKTWKDRVTEYPTRRTLTKTDGTSELVTVARAEGNVSVEGDAFNAATMNDLEERIAEGFSGSDLADTVPYNLIPFPYYEGSHTDNGIDYVVNEDGSVETNGTSTSDQSSLILCYDTVFPKGTYTISGCPSGGKYYRIRVGVNGGSFICSDNGDGATFTLSEDTSLLITIQVLNATTVENLTFKPMLVKGDTAKEYHRSFRSVYEQQTAIIDDLEEIEAVTEKEIPAGALALKAVNAKIKGIEFQIADGKLQYRYDKEVYPDV